MRVGGAAQVRGAMDLIVQDAGGLVRRAHRLATARALGDLVHTHRLVGPPLTVAQAGRAQSAAASRRLRVALLRMPVADVPAAAATRREARRTRSVPVLRANARVGRAVLQPARRPQPALLLAARQPVHATLGAAVVGAEVLGA